MADHASSEARGCAASERVLAACRRAPAQRTTIFGSCPGGALWAAARGLRTASPESPGRSARGSFCPLYPRSASLHRTKPLPAFPRSFGCRRPGSKAGSRDLGEGSSPPECLEESRRARSALPCFGLTLLRRDTQLLVEGRETAGDDRPGVAAALGMCTLAARAPLLRIARGRKEGIDERLLVVGRHEPARPAIGDDRRRAVRPAGDHGQAAGHRLDEDEPERLGDGREDERVGSVQGLGKLLVRAPAGEEDVPVAGPPRCGERMLPLPLARMAADEHERLRLAEQLDGARVRADQERQALDRREATHVEEERAAGPEGSELLVGISDAPGTTALVPAARLLDEPAAPKGAPLRARKRSPREALALDAARETAQLRAL